MPEDKETFRSGVGIADIVRRALTDVRDHPPHAFAMESTKKFGVARKSIDGLSSDPFGRMFASDTGKAALNIVGNESRTLDIIQTMSVDLMSAAIRDPVLRRRPTQFQVNETMRELFVPAADGMPPTLLILDPAQKAGAALRIFQTGIALADGLMRQSGSSKSGGREQAVRMMILESADTIEAALNIAQPEIVVTRRPKMERLCLPDPMQRVESGEELSTAGLYCRDDTGALGITACYHGTGPVGTDVTVGGKSYQVARASEVQDLVFIPLPDMAAPSLRQGSFTVMCDRTPSQYSGATFEGVTSGRTDTKIMSHDAGLLRNRPTAQLRVQTLANSNRGDSGSALIDAEGHVVGFAFEKSAFGEIPEFTDWIWACNALRTLGLTPL